MKNFLRILCYVALGIALVMGDLTVTNWQYWLALLAAAGIQFTSEVL